ncbi:hypothetical protein D9M70_551020 [compost metagenome]
MTSAWKAGAVRYSPQPCLAAVLITWRKASRLFWLVAASLVMKNGMMKVKLRSQDGTGTFIAKTIGMPSRLASAPRTSLIFRISAPSRGMTGENQACPSEGGAGFQFERAPMAKVRRLGMPNWAGYSTFSACSGLRGSL